MASDLLIIGVLEIIFGIGWLALAVWIILKYIVKKKPKIDISDLKDKDDEENL